MTLTPEIEAKILDAIAQLRPFLNDDGGDMEFIEFTENGTVVVKLLGSCESCSMSHVTLKAGIEEALKKACPEVKAVVAQQ